MSGIFLGISVISESTKSKYFCETKTSKKWLIFTLDNIFDLFEGQTCSLVGFWGVSDPLATPPKNRFPGVQEIRPKWTWLGFLDSPRYQSH